MMEVRYGFVVRYAVKIARNMGLSELAIRSMVETLESPTASVELLELSITTAGETYGPNTDIRQRSAATARIIAVVRGFETLMMGGRDPDTALTEIKRRSGTTLDPAVVGELLNVIQKELLAHLTQVIPIASKRNASFA